VRRAAPTTALPRLLLLLLLLLLPAARRLLLLLLTRGKVHGMQRQRPDRAHGLTGCACAARAADWTDVTGGTTCWRIGGSRRRRRACTTEHPHGNTRASAAASAGQRLAQLPQGLFPIKQLQKHKYSKISEALLRHLMPMPHHSRLVLLARLHLQCLPCCCLDALVQHHYRHRRRTAGVITSVTAATSRPPAVLGTPHPCLAVAHGCCCCQQLMQQRCYDALRHSQHRWSRHLQQEQ